MADNNYFYKNFTIFVEDCPARPISYDWKIIQENILCPNNDQEGLCTSITELLGSQLYVRESCLETAHWKKVYHPGFSIENVESNGDIICKVFDNQNQNWSNENKKYKLKWIPMDFSLNSHCRNLKIE